MTVTDQSFPKKTDLSAAKRALLQKRLRGEIKPQQKQTPIPRRQEAGPYQPSFAQERLWFLAQLQPDSSAYNLPFALNLHGLLNLDALKQSLTLIIQRHASLRTIFINTEDGVRQAVLPTADLPFTMLSLHTLSEDEQATRIQTEMAAEASRPFNLAEAPLLRVTLLHLAEDHHLMLYTIHHIIADGWSLGVIRRELSHFYTALTQGHPAELPALPIQYPDFALWQREWLQGDSQEKQLAYWKKHLAHAPPTLTLPLDHPRPANQTYATGREPVHLPVPLVEQLKALNRTANVTLFMVLLAAFKVLLYRYSGQENIVVGTPVANRNRVELEGLIGFLLNTLALHTDLSDQPTFQTLLGRIRGIVLGAFQHQDIPFERLVEELKPERSLNTNPIFQVMLIFHNTPEAPLSLPGLEVSYLPGYGELEKFDLTLSLIERPDGIRGYLSYNADLFEPATMQRMLGHFETILAHVVADPQQSIATLTLIPEVERQQLLIDWNATAAPYDLTATIHRHFEAQVARTPDATALIDGTQRLTYHQINSRANQLAHHLLDQGLSPEGRVGLCMERSPELVIALLAILKAGGAYLPLDPNYPAQRLRFMLTDAQPALIITQHHLQERLPAENIPTLTLDDPDLNFSHLNPENLDVAIDGDSLAYILYTSGSTGQPKGVLGLHRGAINRFKWMWETYPFTNNEVYNEVCCHKTTLNFVDSVWEIFGPLLQGVPLVLIPDAVLKDPPLLVQALADHQVTRLVLVPSLLRVLLDTQPNLAERLPYLGMIITSGEAIPVDLARRFLDTMPHTNLINLYGSSEVAADVTYFDLRQHPPHTIEPGVPIGQPIANTQIYLLDVRLQPVPLGVPGELYVAGAGLARGYLDRPDLTAERFIQVDTLIPATPLRLFKTGDLARWNETGQLEFLGRRDHQVKIRGQRVELGEIEATLQQQPGVHQVVVNAREEAPGDTRLVAYLTPAHQDLEALRHALKQTLPDYMIPAAFVPLESLPLTPNGKINRLALPAPDYSRQSTQTYQPPRNLVEEQMVEIWQQVLNVGSVSIDDNFFDLGGHSLLAVELFAHIEQVFDKALPLVTLFQAPTLRTLAEVVRQEGWRPSNSALVPIQPLGDKPPFFCVTPPRGSVVGFSGLAQHLGTDQPFYGLHFEGINTWQRQQGVTDNHPIQEVAAHYIREIRTLQPQGPYFIGGRCYGAHIAYEMATQLLAQEESVALLAIMTTPPRDFQASRLHYLKRAVSHIRHRRLLHALRLALPAGYPQFKRRLRKRVKRLTSHPSSTSSTANSVKPTSDAPYKHPPYPGRIVVFQTSDATQAAWAALAQGGLDFHIIPGTHLDIFHEPNVRQLAQALQTAMTQAQQ